MRLPSQDSAVMRGIKTAIQVLVAVLIWAAADPNVRAIVTHWYPQALPALMVTAGLVSIVYNVLRPSVPNY